MRLVLLAAATLLLTGCGSSLPDVSDLAVPPSTTATTSTTPAAPPTSTTTDAAENERKNLVMKLGEEAGYGHDGEFVTFTIDKIDVDPSCSDYGTKPDSGHTLLLHVRVTTGDDPELAERTSGIINPLSFSEIDKDGVTRQATIGSCTGFDEMLPLRFGVNQKYEGTIELVVPEANGTLNLQGVAADEGGWEWHY